MNARLTRKTAVLAVFLLGGIFAAAANLEAAAPWFRPGGLRPMPRGDRDKNRDPERDRDGERRRNRYGEQRFVRHLYQGFLNRQPSAAELSDWVDRLGRDANPTELVQEFMNSDEFFVRQTYRGLLGREADASGMNTYMDALRNGQSRADVVEAFLSSDEFRQKLQ